MKNFSFWLKTVAIPSVLLMVGGIVAFAMSSNYAPGSKERCDELYKLIYGASSVSSAPAYTAEDKAEYAKYCVPQASPQVVPSTESAPSPTSTASACEEMKKIIESGQYTDDQKQLYLKCQGGTEPPPTLESVSIEEQPRKECEDLRYKLEKYSGDPNSDEYRQTKEAYGKACYAKEKEIKSVEPKPFYKKEDLCPRLEQALKEGKYTAEEKAMYAKLCRKEKPVYPENQFCDKMKKLMESGDGYTAEDKMAYYKVCLQKTAESFYAPENDECRALREKIVAYNNEGLANTPDYMELKKKFQQACEKQKIVPPAGYEEEVLDDYEDYGNPFPDTDIESREGKAAAELYRRGVLGGFPDGEFKGDKPVNRAEAAKFLLLACARDTKAENEISFRDVVNGQWYAPYVRAAAALGIIKGYSDNTFRPGKNVNRAEFAKMIAMACKLPENLDYSLFTDITDEDWFAPFAGVVQKYSLYPDSAVDNLFKAGNPMTRAEVATAIYQYLTNR